VLEADASFVYVEKLLVDDSQKNVYEEGAIYVDEELVVDAEAGVLVAPYQQN
jgi:hypothetical protein